MIDDLPDDDFDDDEEVLPEHKRTGYAERMYEQADMLRKERREDDLINRSDK